MHFNYNKIRKGIIYIISDGEQMNLGDQSTYKYMVKLLYTRKS